MSKPNNAKTVVKQKSASKTRRSEAETPANHASSEPSGVVTLDRRRSADRRTGGDRRQRNEPVAIERRVFQRREKVARRRQIDPTTCERDYSADEVEFMNALDLYKRTNGRMFPTCSEILEVIRSLGYEKRTNPSVAADQPVATAEPVPPGENSGTGDPSAAGDPLSDAAHAGSQTDGG